MRLSQKSIDAIKESVRAAFGDARVFLFGSRADDGKRGGDIDLLVVHSPEINDVLAKIKAITKIQRLIGEQKIDMITTTNPKTDARLVVQIATEEGVELL